MTPLSDEEKIASVRRWIPEGMHARIDDRAILAIATGLGDQWHIARFPRYVAGVVEDTFKMPSVLRE